MKLDNIDFGYPFKSKIFTDFSWELPQGVVVMLGPNGAGKSTLMGLMTSVLKPHSGTIAHHGMMSTQQKAWRRRVGWVPQHPAVLPGLTVVDQLAYAGWLHGCSEKASTVAASRVLEQVDLTHLSHRRTRQLSGGEQRRLAIGCALVVEPDLLVMDEPTAGLDPAQRRRFRELITTMRETVDIVISTHQTEDLSLTAHSVAVLDAGVMRFSGSLSDFLKRSSRGVDRSERAQSAYERIMTEADSS